MSSYQARQVARLRVGVCHRCGDELKTRTMCAKCAAGKVRATMKRRATLIAEGRCVRCKGPRGESAGETLCAACLKRQNAETRSRYGARRDAGQCSVCSSPSTFSRCLEHRLAKAVR